jgi:hypothetical protein
MQYIDAQLFKAIPMPLTEANSSDERNGQIRLQVRTKHGATNWLNVSPSQMRDIETILNKTEVQA